MAAAHGGYADSNQELMEKCSLETLLIDHESPPRRPPEHEPEYRKPNMQTA